MKPVSGTLATWLDATTTGWWRHLIAITPKTGSVLYLTDHTSAISYGGHSYLSGSSGTTPVVAYRGRKQAAGLESSELSFDLLAGEGATLFGSTPVVQSALANAFDGAWIRIERIYGTDPASPVDSMPLHEGPVTSAKASSSRVAIVVGSGIDELANLYPPKIIQPGCRHRLFDSGCTLVQATFEVSRTADTGSTATSIVPNSAITASPQFQDGLIWFTAGTLNGQTRGIRSHTTTAIVPDLAFSAAPSVGDAFKIIPGCPKTLDANGCGVPGGANGKFGVNNSANFGGFPFVPKPETVLG